MLMDNSQHVEQVDHSDTQEVLFQQLGTEGLRYVVG